VTRRSEGSRYGWANDDARLRRSGRQSSRNRSGDECKRTPHIVAVVKTTWARRRRRRVRRPASQCVIHRPYVREHDLLELVDPTRNTQAVRAQRPSLFEGRPARGAGRRARRSRRRRPARRSRGREVRNAGRAPARSRPRRRARRHSRSGRTRHPWSNRRAAPPRSCRAGRCRPPGSLGSPRRGSARRSSGWTPSGAGSRRTPPGGGPGQLDSGPTFRSSDSPAAR